MPTSGIGGIQGGGDLLGVDQQSLKIQKDVKDASVHLGALQETFTDTKKSLENLVADCGGSHTKQGKAAQEILDQFNKGTTGDVNAMLSSLEQLRKHS